MGALEDGLDKDMVWKVTRGFEKGCSRELGELRRRLGIMFVHPGVAEKVALAIKVGIFSLTFKLDEFDVRSTLISSLQNSQLAKMISPLSIHKGPLRSNDQSLHRYPTHPRAIPTTCSWNLYAKIQGLNRDIILQ